MPTYISGARTTFDSSNDIILDMQKYLDYIPDDNMDVAFLKRIGINSEPAKSTKIEWTQTALRGRGETVTLADGSGTSLTVADTGQYQIGELIRIENEVVRVTALASATVLTITRAYAGTTGAAHSAKLAYSLGKAAAENSTPGAAVSDTVDKLFNYAQTFDVPVEMSMDQIMMETVDGNTISGQLERRFIEVNRQLARSVLYGIKHRDATNKIHTMGGLISFLSSNVTNVGGALGLSAIDALILDMVQDGADPKTIHLNPYQKQKLDALDNNKQLLGKKEHTGGGLMTNTWQSGILNHPLDIVVDRSILTDQLIITDDDYIEIKPFSNNGRSGAWATLDATAPGQDGEKKVIRGKYTMKVHNEKAHGYLYGLT